MGTTMFRKRNAKVPDIRKPPAIFFDWDGTLVNTLPGLRKAHNHVRTSYGHDEWTEAEFRANLRHSARELYPRLYAENAPEALERLYDYVKDHHLATLEVIDGAKDLDHFFLSCIGAGQAARDKPAADPLMLALDRSGIDIDLSQLWYVGDTVTDLEVSAAAGCRSILLLDGENKDEMIRDHKPFLVLENCRALEHFVATLL